MTSYLLRELQLTIVFKWRELYPVWSCERGKHWTEQQGEVAWLLMFTVHSARTGFDLTLYGGGASQRHGWKSFPRSLRYSMWHWTHVFSVTLEKNPWKKMSGGNSALTITVSTFYMINASIWYQKVLRKLLSSWFLYDVKVPIKF